MPTDTDTNVIDRLSASERGRRRFQRLSTVMSRVDIKSPVTIWRWIEEDRFPKPVQINGYRFWYEDEIDDWINNQPRGQGFRPVVALGERARRIEARREEARQAENIREGRSKEQPDGGSNNAKPVASTGLAAMRRCGRSSRPPASRRRS
jgi:prophage regulatory protein